MVRHVDDVSFFSLLHPEEYTAVATTEPAASGDGNTATPWAAVYNEAISEFRDENVPVAIQVVAVDEDCQDTRPISGGGISRRTTSRSNSNAEDSPSDNDDDFEAQSRPGRKKRKLQPWKHSNLIDLILGFSLTITCILVTVKLEIAAILIYILAAGSQWLGDERLVPFKPLLFVLVAIFMFVDAVLLTVSVLVTEILGWVAHLLCTIFGGPRSGREWHQFIRKTCHLSRWAFRNFHKGWKPERVFPIPMTMEASMLQQTEALQEAELEVTGGGRNTGDGDHDENSGSNGDRRRAYSDVPQRQTSVGDRYRTYSDVPVPPHTNNMTATASVISEVTFTEATARSVNAEPSSSEVSAAAPIAISAESVVQVISEDGVPDAKIT